MNDFEIDYDAALLKRHKLEEEIDASDASTAQKSDMRHSLSKLWLAVQSMRDWVKRRPA